MTKYEAWDKIYRKHCYMECKLKKCKGIDCEYHIALNIISDTFDWEYINGHLQHIAHRENI